MACNQPSRGNSKSDRGRGSQDRGSTPRHGRGNGVNGSRGGRPHKQQIDFSPSSSPALINTKAKGEQAGLSSLSRDLGHLHNAVDSLRNELFALKGENSMLKNTVMMQQENITKLEQELDDLQQYGRRENVCFSNLKFNEESPVMSQVIDLCDGLNVAVSDSDFVDVHPLPSRNGRAKRVVARFKDRKLAQKVMGARKASKNIEPNRKAKLAADPKRGFGIQPNITPKRSALLAQSKAAVEKASLDGTWIDIKTGAVLLRLRQGDRPRVIRNTLDIVNLVPTYVPNEYVFCMRPYDKSYLCTATETRQQDDIVY